MSLVRKPLMSKHLQFSLLRANWTCNSMQQGVQKDATMLHRSYWLAVLRLFARGGLSWYNSQRNTIETSPPLLLLLSLAVIIMIM